VVGQLQFDVIQFRLEKEYGAKSRFEPCRFRLCRWVVPKKGLEDAFQKGLDELSKSYETVVSKDAEERWAILCASEYALKKAQERFSDVEFLKTSEVVSR